MECLRIHRSPSNLRRQLIATKQTSHHAVPFTRANPTATAASAIVTSADPITASADGKNPPWLIVCKITPTGKTTEPISSAIAIPRRVGSLNASRSNTTGQQAQPQLKQHAGWKDYRSGEQHLDPTALPFFAEKHVRLNEREQHR